MGRLRSTAKRSKWLVYAASVADDQRSRLAAKRGAPPSTSGSTHSGFSLDESIAYIDVVFEDYLRYGRLTPGDLAGTRVLELGPGDNFGVALRFLGAGAEGVVALDKFASVRDLDQQRAIYSELISRADPESRARMEAALDLEALTFDPDRLRAIEGVAVEDAAGALAGERFDLIVSRAVLEHLYDLDAAFAAMDALLRTGGVLLHKVDFRDHGMFTGGGMHPLTFLTLPDRAYGLMSRHSGRPNRKLADWYRAKLGELGYDSEALVTHVVGRGPELDPYPAAERFDPGDHPDAVGLARAIRPRLEAGCRELEDRDLIVAGIFIRAEKPG